MKRSIVMLAVACFVAATVVLAADDKPAGKEDASKKGAFSFVDLQPQSNWKRTDTGGGDDNHLGELPGGEQTLDSVKFKIGDSVIQLAGMEGSDRPDKVEGIKVDRKLNKLHILHANQYAAPDDTIIGSYTVNYDDQSQETIAIVYGKDVRDWWESSDAKETTRGKLAWTGENPAVKNAGTKLRLYHATWKNPKPERKIVSIDFASTKSSAAAPFCVAISCEGD